MHHQFRASGVGLILWLFYFLIGASVVIAQTPAAAIRGIVKDQSAAVVPGATLTATQLETGQIHTTTSGEDGSFRFEALPAGAYQVQAEHAGFHTSVQEVTLAGAQTAVVNVALEVGGVSESVTVTGEAPIVNTESGSLGGLMEEKTVANMPVNGRNFMDLVLTQPGVRSASIGGTGGAIVRGMHSSSNGMPQRSNLYLLDGAQLQSFEGSSAYGSVSDSTLGMDGIQEMRVVTAMFDAQYGMALGSSTIISSKPGTSKFHGTAFEFFRNSALDARNFFDYVTAVTPGRLPLYQRNQFGGSLGGPIKKDRTFFDVVYEDVEQNQGATTIYNTMPAYARVNSGLVPQISPVVQPLLQFFPLPNLSENRYTFPFQQPDSEHFGQARVDHRFSNSDSMFARYTITNTSIKLAGDIAIFPYVDGNRDQFVTLSETHIFSPAILNTMQLSFSRTDVFGLLAATVPSGPQFSFLPGLPIGSIDIGGVTRNTGAGPNYSIPMTNIQNITAWNDDLYYRKGAHSLKFGALVDRFNMWLLSGTDVRGRVSFADMQDFLAGGPVYREVDVTPGSLLDRDFLNTVFGFYAQDDWHVAHNFTLNLGIRYEPTTAYTEKFNRSPVLQDVRNDVNTTYGSPFENPSLKNIGPRFGFAWDVMGDGRTAVRGGFAEEYDVTGSFHGAMISMANPPLAGQDGAANLPTFTVPFSFPASDVGKTLRQTDYHMGQPHALEYNLTVEHRLPWNTALTVSYVGTRGIDLLTTVDGNPTVPQVLPNGQLFWTGTESRINPNWNAIELRTAAADSWYNGLQVSFVKRLSQGLEFNASYTFSKTLSDAQGGFSPESVYPGKISIDKEVTGVPQNLRFNATYHLPAPASSGTGLGKFLSGWDLRGGMSLTSGAPFTPLLQTDPSQSQINQGSFATTWARPDILPGRNNGNITSGTTAGCPGVAPGQQLGTPQLYFDPCAFAVQPTGFLGNAGRGILIGPGAFNVDASIVKTTPLKSLNESAKLEFRGEVYNLLNHPNFTAPEAVVYPGVQSDVAAFPNVGEIQRTRNPRQISLALKLTF